MTREISQYFIRLSSPKTETVCQSGKEEPDGSFDDLHIRLPSLVWAIHPPNKHDASPHLSPAASRNALRASAYHSQRSSTCSTVSSPRPHSHAGLSASFFPEETGVQAAVLRLSLHQDGRLVGR